MAKLWHACVFVAAVAVAGCRSPPPQQGAPGDPAADPFVNAMVQNDSEFQDITADILRVYLREGIDDQSAAHDCTGVFKKKGRDKVYILEDGTVDYYRRQFWVSDNVVTMRMTATGETTVGLIPWDLHEAANLANWDTVLDGTEGDLGIVRFIPLPGTQAESVVASIRRWIDAVTGAVHRSEVESLDGTWTVVTVNSNVQPIGANGPFMALRQELVFTWDGGSMTRITDFSNVVINTGIPDQEFVPVAMAETNGIKTAFGLLPLCLLAGAGVNLIGRRRLRAARDAGSAERGHSAA